MLIPYKINNHTRNIYNKFHYKIIKHQIEKNKNFNTHFKMLNSQKGKEIPQEKAGLK